LAAGASQRSRYSLNGTRHEWRDGRRRRKPRNGRGHFTFFGKVVTGFGFFGGEAERESTETLAVVDMQTQLPGRSRWILKAWRASAAHREQA
jgi:hypothetical protein